LAQHLRRRFQEVIKGKAFVITKQMGQLPCGVFSRGDRH
jgi:hypothetical protein